MKLCWWSKICLQQDFWRSRPRFQLLREESGPSGPELSDTFWTQCFCWTRQNLQNLQNLIVFVAETWKMFQLFSAGQSFTVFVEQSEWRWIFMRLLQMRSHFDVSHSVGLTLVLVLVLVWSRFRWSWSSGCVTSYIRCYLSVLSVCRYCFCLCCRVSTRCFIVNLPGAATSTHLICFLLC